MLPLVFLAKEAVETFIKERKIISPPKDLGEEFLNEKAGVFVTIEKGGKLRACIGTYLPTQENIAKEVIYSAIAAATEDWRFGPIEKEEFPLLSYIVYILNEPQPVKGLKELNPKKYGILVKSGTKSGLLLPDLEGIDSPEKQIFIACQKGGIDPTKEKVLIYKFTVKKYQ